MILLSVNKRTWAEHPSLPLPDCRSGVPYAAMLLRSDGPRPHTSSQNKPFLNSLLLWCCCWSTRRRRYCNRPADFPPWVPVRLPIFWGPQGCWGRESWLSWFSFISPLKALTQILQHHSGVLGVRTSRFGSWGNIRHNMVVHFLVLLSPDLAFLSISLGAVIQNAFPLIPSHPVLNGPHFDLQHHSHDLKIQSSCIIF